MIVTCPSCATRYLVDPLALGSTGRLVRCARCAHTWPEKPPADMPKRVDVVAPPEGVRPIPPGSNLPALRDQPPPRDWAGWAAIAMVVIAVTAGGIIGRQQVMAAWPATVRLYTLVGLIDPLPSQAFQLRNVQQDEFVENETTYVSLTGEIVNVSNKILPIPRVSARIIDKDHQAIKEWIVEPAQTDLGPGETAIFSKRLTDRPRDGEKLTVGVIDE